MRINGTVKFFHRRAGYGFLLPDDKGPEVFVHIKALKASGFNTLQNGERVSFEHAEGRPGTGPRAINLQRA